MHKLVQTPNWLFSLLSWAICSIKLIVNMMFDLYELSSKSNQYQVAKGSICDLSLKLINKYV